MAAVGEECRVERGFFVWLVGFFFVKMGQMTAFLYAGGNDPIKKEKTLIHEREG